MSTTLTAPRTVAVEQTVVEQTAIERWKVDPTHTVVEFDVKHLCGLHTVHGRFTRFDGSYVNGPAGPQLELIVDSSSVDTGVAMRDEHLHGPDFLYVALHPQMRFASTRVTPAGDGKVHVSGELQAVGVTLALEFDAALHFVEDELGLEATTTVDQERLGMTSGPLGHIQTPTKVHVKARLVPDGVA